MAECTVQREGQYTLSHIHTHYHTYIHTVTHTYTLSYTPLHFAVILLKSGNKRQNFLWFAYLLCAIYYCEHIHVHVFYYKDALKKVTAGNCRYYSCYIELHST